MARCSYLRDLAIRDSLNLPGPLADLVIGYSILSPTEKLRLILAPEPMAIHVLWRVHSGTWRLNDTFADAIHISLDRGMVFIRSVTGIFSRRVPVIHLWELIQTRIDETRTHRHLGDNVELASKGHEDTLFDMVVEY